MDPSQSTEAAAGLMPETSAKGPGVSEAPTLKGSNGGKAKDKPAKAPKASKNTDKSLPKPTQPSAEDVYVMTDPDWPSWAQRTRELLPAGPVVTRAPRVLTLAAAAPLVVADALVRARALLGAPTTGTVLCEVHPDDWDAVAARLSLSMALQREVLDDLATGTRRGFEVPDEEIVGFCPEQRTLAFGSSLLLTPRNRRTRKLLHPATVPARVSGDLIVDDLESRDAYLWRVARACPDAKVHVLGCTRLKAWGPEVLAPAPPADLHWWAVPDVTGDALRGFLLAPQPFSPSRLASFANALAASWGNLLFRPAAFISKKLAGRIPDVARTEADAAVAARVALAESVMRGCFGSGAFEEALQTLLSVTKELNGYLNDQNPWVLGEPGTDAYARAGSVLGLTLELLVQLAACAAPLFPASSAAFLGSVDLEGRTVGEVTQLLPKVDAKAAAAMAPLFQPLGRDLAVKVRRVRDVSDWPVFVGLLWDFSNKARLSTEGARWRQELVQKTPAPAELLARPDVAAFGDTSSVHNLADKVAKAGKLPDINALVDVYNAVSYHYGLSMGAYDLKSAGGPEVVYALATGSEQFWPMDDVAQVRVGQPVLRDLDGNVITTHEKQSVSSQVSLRVWVSGIEGSLKGLKGS